MITVHKFNTEDDLHKFIKKSKFTFCKLYSAEEISLQYENVHQVKLKPYDYRFVLEMWENDSFGYKHYEHSENNLRLLYTDPELIRTYFYYDNIFDTYLDYMKMRKPYASGLYTSTGVGYKSKQKSIAGGLTFSGVFTQSRLVSSKMNEATEYNSYFNRGSVLTDLINDNKYQFISGTASINEKGEVVHLNDAYHQYEKIKENINTLSDVKFEEYDFYILYLKSFDLLSVIFMNVFKDMKNLIILEADICREDWLLEIECVQYK